MHNPSSVQDISDYYRKINPGGLGSEQLWTPDKEDKNPQYIVDIGEPGFISGITIEGIFFFQSISSLSLDPQIYRCISVTSCDLWGGIVDFCNFTITL